MSGFNVGHLHIPGVGTWSLEISDDAAFEARMREINAMLRFKHKISNPQWETRKVGGGTPVAAPKPKAKAAKRVPKRQQKEPEPVPVKLPEPDPVPLQREREGSVEGTIDIAAARRLARSS